MNFLKLVFITLILNISLIHIAQARTCDENRFEPQVTMNNPNNFADLFVTAVSSTTSAITSYKPCPKEINNDIKAKGFINSSYEQLVKDIMQTKGSFIDGLLQIYLCDTSKNQTIINNLKPSITKFISLDFYKNYTQEYKENEFFNIFINTLKSQHSNDCIL